MQINLVVVVEKSVQTSLKNTVKLGHTLKNNNLTAANSTPYEETLPQSWGPRQTLLWLTHLVAPISFQFFSIAASKLIILITIINTIIWTSIYNRTFLLYISHSCAELTSHFTDIWGAGLAYWWERSPPTNKSRVQYPILVSYVGWVCCWPSTLLREVFLRNDGHFWTSSLSSLVLRG